MPIDGSDQKNQKSFCDISDTSNQFYSDDYSDQETNIKNQIILESNKDLKTWLRSQALAYLEPMMASLGNKI